MAAKIAGRLVSLTVGEGNLVRKGQVVANADVGGCLAIL